MWRLELRLWRMWLRAAAINPHGQPSGRGEAGQSTGVIRVPCSRPRFLRVLQGILTAWVKRRRLSFLLLLLLLILLILPLPLPPIQSNPIQLQLQSTYLLPIYLSTYILSSSPSSSSSSSSSCFQEILEAISSLNARLLFAVPFVIRLKNRLHTPSSAANMPLDINLPSKLPCSLHFPTILISPSPQIPEVSIYPSIHPLI